MWHVDQPHVNIKSNWHLLTCHFKVEKKETNKQTNKQVLIDVEGEKNKGKFWTSNGVTI